jgi:hypothetical protein
MVVDKKEIAPGIVIYKNVISNFEFLVKDIEEAADTGLVTWNKAYVIDNSVKTISENTRDTSIMAIPYKRNSEIDPNNQSLMFLNKMSNIFYESFNVLEDDYCNSYNFLTHWHDAYTILKYSVGQKFTNHIDDHKNYIRRISTIYYINDNYLGGEINFPRFDISYKPQENELLVFPSNYVYNHSVTPVTEGTRYSVVSWMS